MAFFLITLFLTSIDSFPLFEDQAQSTTLFYFLQYGNLLEYIDFVQEYCDVTCMYSIGVIFFITYGTVFKKLKVSIFFYKTNFYKSIFFFKNSYFLVNSLNLFIGTFNLRQKKLK